MVVGQGIGRRHLVGLDAKVHVPVGVAHPRRDLRRSDAHARSGLRRIPLPAAKRDGPAVAHQEAIAGTDLVRGGPVEKTRRRAALFAFPCGTSSVTSPVNSTYYPSVRSARLRSVIRSLPGRVGSTA